MAHADARWVFEIAGSALWVAMLVFFVWKAYREKRMSAGALIFIAASTLWWQEWYGSWGAYLLYNPDFALIDWGTTKWTTPNKPWAVIPTYGWYFTLLCTAIFWLLHRVRRWRPEWPPLVTLFAVTLPVFYVWNVAVEGVAAALAWSSYTDGWGPAITTDNGRYPLVYPVLVFAFFGVVLMWFLGRTLRLYPGRELSPRAHARGIRCPSRAGPGPGS